MDKPCRIVIGKDGKAFMRIIRDPVVESAPVIKPPVVKPPVVIKPPVDIKKPKKKKGLW